MLKSGRGRTIYVAGAGIAGLTLALALAKFGATVIVLERAEELQDFGAGLQLSPNARRVLNQLGLDKAITAKSFEPQGIDVFPFGAAQPLATMQLGEAVRTRFGAPYAVMHRADLLDALYRATRRFANIDVVLGVTDFDAIAHSKGVSIVAELGANGARDGRGFAFVGADGINSVTRTKILEGPAPRWTGSVAWRALVDLAAVGGLMATDRTSLFFAPGYHAVLYPLPHRGQVNVALFLQDNRLRGQAPDRTAPILPKSKAPNLAFEAMLELAHARWGHWPVGTVEASHWSQGAIGLIGDAAHAMLPFQAQGAAMAIEDAAILAPLLMTEPTAETAFKRYAALRRRRVHRVASLSASNGLAFHMGWPLSIARDLGVRVQGHTGHLRRLKWLYGYDPSPEVEGTDGNRPV